MIEIDELKGLAEGRIVHYVLDEGPGAGQHRPAIVVRNWSDDGAGCVQLQVFTDSYNDGLENVVWRSSALYNREGAPGTWHWPERVDCSVRFLQKPNAA